MTKELLDRAMEGADVSVRMRRDDDGLHIRVQHDLIRADTTIDAIMLGWPGFDLVNAVEEVVEMAQWRIVSQGDSSGL